VIVVAAAGRVRRVRLGDSVVEAYPELGEVSAQVTTRSGPGAEEVEQLITVPLERQINGTPGPVPDALDQHVRPVADHRAVPRRLWDYWVRQRLL